MPEGPQMVFLKEQLEHFIDHVVLSVKGNAKDIPGDRITGRTLTDIKTFGKEILFCFNDFTVRVHLMLFGKYAIDTELNRVLRLGFQFDNGDLNFYAAECRFIEAPLDTIYDWTADVMNPTFDPKKALKKLQNKPRLIICEALLDQNILAGVGNKIKNEVLFRQQIHPESLVGEIPKKELQKLIQDCVVLSRDYLQWKKEGIDNEPWKVYKKKECPRDLIPIQKEKLGKSGRSCYFCDRCQKLYTTDSI